MRAARPYGAWQAMPDILIENFKRWGGLKKYGLDYDSLKALNPGLIYCSVTGFGQSGPYAPRAGYDFLIQGIGRDHGPDGAIPRASRRRSAWPSPTSSPGSTGVIAIQAALRQRGTGTGEGRPYRPWPLLDSLTGVLGQLGHELSRLPGARRRGWAMPIPMWCGLIRSFSRATATPSWPWAMTVSSGA